VNQVHGSVFEFVRNAAFDDFAKPYFRNIASGTGATENWVTWNSVPSSSMSSTSLISDCRRTDCAAVDLGLSAGPQDHPGRSSFP
jgi:hypothetical protein